MKLYGYYRSSAAYRVRIALEWKGVEVERASVALAAGEQTGEAYRALNPQGLVPALEVEGETIPQSLAILEYLEERFPEPPILPREALDRARVRALAALVACDVHPLNNLRVLRYLEREVAVGEPARLAWYRHWIAEGFDALERLLSTNEQTGRFCHGSAPTLADVCLVPQVYNARRFETDLSPWPTIVRIDQACGELPAFQRAAPEAQPDAPRRSPS